MNTYTTNWQDEPAVAPDGSGGFVVVWESYGSGGIDQSANSVQGQQFNSDGTPNGGEFQVNTYTTSYQYSPAIGPDGTGGFVVVWQGYGSGENVDYGIHGQRFGSDGSPAGSEFKVNSYTTSSQREPVVASDGAGGFVVVWRSGWSNGTDPSNSVQLRRFTSDGSAIGIDFQVNTYIFSNQVGPAVGPDGAGGFVVVWGSQGSSGTDSSSSSIQAQRFGSDGSLDGSEFQVNTYTSSAQSGPAVGPDGAGGFVVTWTSTASSGPDLDVTSIQAQRFGSNGAPVGNEFQMNTFTTDAQTQSAVSSDGVGFVVTWTSQGGSSDTDSDGDSVQGQRFGSDGNPLGAEFQVNTYTSSSQRRSSVAPDGSGGFVVAWNSDGSSGNDSEGNSVQAQRLEIPPLFADGFDSGDTNAWSSAVP